MLSVHHHHSSQCRCARYWTNKSDFIIYKMRGDSVIPIDVFWPNQCSTEGQSYMITLPCLVLWPNCVNKQRLPSHKNWEETKMSINFNSCHVFIYLISLFDAVELFVLLGPHVWLMFGGTKWTNDQKTEVCGLLRYVVYALLSDIQSQRANMMTV